MPLGRFNTTGMKKKAEQIDAFNRAVPVGTEVILTRNNGEQVRTRTRSAAQLLGGHTPVVWLEGIAGCWELEYVQAIPAAGVDARSRGDYPGAVGRSGRPGPGAPKQP